MRIGKANGHDWLRLSEAAEKLGVSPNTLRRWSDTGKLVCYRSPGGHRRYRRSDVDDALTTQSRDDRGVLAATDSSHPASVPDTHALRTSLDALAQVAAEGVGVTACRFMLSAGGDRVQVAGLHDPASHEPAAVERLVDCPAEAEVLRSGRRLVISDMKATNLLTYEAAEAYRDAGYDAMLALPIHVTGRIVGVLRLAERGAPRPFTGANVAFAEFMARQAAHLMVDQRYEPAAESRAGRDQVQLALQEPHEGRVLEPADSKSPGDILSELAQRLRLDLHAVACDVLRYDPDRDAVTMVAAASEGEPPPVEGAWMPVGSLLGGTELLAGKPVELPGLSAPSLSGTRLMRSEGTGARSLLSVPVSLGSRILGAMDVYSADPARRYEPHERTLIDAAASVAALALSGAAGLAGSLARFDEAPAGKSHAAPGAEVSSLAAAAAGVMASLLGQSYAAVYLLDDEAAFLLASSPFAVPRESWALADHPAAASVVSQRRSRVVGFGEDRLPAAKAACGQDTPGLRCALLVPLLFAGASIGLVEVGGSDPDTLRNFQADAQALAGLLATAIGNGAVAARLQRRSGDLAAVFDDSLGEFTRLNTEEVLHSVVQRLAELTGSPVVDLYAVEGDTMRALASWDGGRFDSEWDGVVVPLSRYPMSRLAVDTGDMVTTPRLEDPLLDDESRHSLEKWGYQSQLSLPLQSGARVIGLLELSDYVPREYAAEADVARRLGQIAVHALENAGLVEQAERRSRVLNELVELGNLSGRTSDLELLLRRVAERLQQALDAANCDILRVSPEGLRCVASFDRSGYDERSVGELLDQASYPTLVRAMHAQQTLIVTSPDDAQLTERERRTYRDLGYASEVCVPLIINERLYGLIDIYDTRERDYAEFLSFLRSAAQILASAFENSELVDQLERRSRVLREIVELGALTSQAHDLQNVLGVLAERLRATIDATDCDIFTLQGDQFRCLVSADLDGLDETVVGHVLDMDKFPATAMAVRSGQPMTVPSLEDPRLSAQERDDMGEYGYQSELCIPLVAGERVIGLIDVFDTRERDYAEYVDFLRSVGQTAAGAIENAMLVDELERRNTALAELVELSKVIAGAGGVDELARSVGPRVVEVLGAHGVQVFSVQDGRLHCLLTYEDGHLEDDFVDSPLDLDLFPSTREALERAETLVIESPDDPRLGEYERELYAQAGTRSEIRVPLTVNGRVVGLLDVYDRRSRDYAEHRDFLINAAQLLAGAFAQAVLVDELETTNRMLNLLVESGIEFGATLELEEVLHCVARRLCVAAAAPCCEIYVVDDERFRCVVCVEDGQADEDYVGTAYPLAELPASRDALQERRPLVVTHVSADERLTEQERLIEARWGVEAKLELPLVSRGEVIGMAGLFDYHPRDFAQLDLLQSLAQGAANALANATLFERVDRAVDRLALVNDVIFELSSSLGLSDVLTSAARRLCAIAGLPACDLYTLHDGDVLRNVVSLVNGEIDSTWQGREFPLSTWRATEKAVRTRNPVLVRTIDDPLLSQEERVVMQEFGETGDLAVPLIAKDRVIGVLELMKKQGPCDLSEELIETIFAAAGVAALAIDNANLYEDIKRLHLSNLKALSSVLNAKDYYTLGHAARVAAYMVLLGRELGWPEDLMRDVEEVSYLHDIGKIGVSDRVLLKPSGLNAPEWELMRQHPIFSADIIQPLFSDELVAGVRHHHECYDGSGYPDGLSGSAIPELARAMCVADSYDAMSFRRPYHVALTYAECLQELEGCSGRQFDPGMVSAFKRVLERVADGRRLARDIAAEAAARIDAEQHAALRTPDDERRPEYAAISAVLREVQAAHPPTRHISTHMRSGKKTAIVCDSPGPSSAGPHIGDETVTYDEFVEVFASRDLDATVLFVDQRGVWISGVAPILDADGAVAAVVAADLPATEDAAELEGLQSRMAHTFSSVLQTAATQAERSEIEAITDTLTGLYNHRYFHERLSEELERCQEQGARLALLLLDLDDFRAFNERHGHSAGDRALRSVARVIERSMRHVDLAARYGGQEFAAVLIDTGESGALDVAERIRQGVMEAELTGGGDTLSMSIGVAVCPDDASFKEELIDKADWAMFLAKRRGRNTVVAFNAEHGADTPEQAATVHADYVAAMTQLVAAHEAYARRSSSAIAHLSLAVARELGLEGDALREVASAVAGAGATTAAADPADAAQTIVALATTYQELVVEARYRPHLSEAEALAELLGRPALLHDRELAQAFRRVLSG